MIFWMRFIVANHGAVFSSPLFPYFATLKNYLTFDGRAEAARIGEANVNKL